MKKILILPVLIVMLSSCATIFTSSKITVGSDQVTETVELSVDGKNYAYARLPYKIKLKRGSHSNVITAYAAGYEPASVVVNKKFNAASVGNLLSVLGWGIDAATGAITKPEYKYYAFNFRRSPSASDPQNYVEDPTIMAGEAQNMVTRDNPGQTELEKSIIRWHIDSDPRGARIFYRVISSIPAVVKNTNETYILTTPFEETRAFNILGLTYENSRDVQIEFKVTKVGYEDQIKRFNVRQAIDQQEISSFFELVPKAQ